MEEKVKEFLEELKRTLNEEQEEVDEQKKQLKKKQESLNKLRNQIIDLEKELYPQIIAEGDIPQKIIQVPTVTIATLEEAKEILFGEFALETDMSARIVNALRRCNKLKTLEDLYHETLKDPKYTKIRQIGEKSAEEIRESLIDMEKTIKKIKKRRGNIHEYNQSLKFLLDEETVKKWEKTYKVTTLSELYDYYTRMGYYSLKIKNLLNRY